MCILTLAISACESRLGRPPDTQDLLLDAFIVREHLLASGVEIREWMSAAQSTGVGTGVGSGESTIIEIQTPGHRFRLSDNYSRAERFGRLYPLEAPVSGTTQLRLYPSTNSVSDGANSKPWAVISKDGKDQETYTVSLSDEWPLVEVPDRSAIAIGPDNAQIRRSPDFGIIVSYPGIVVVNKEADGSVEIIGPGGKSLFIEPDGALTIVADDDTVVTYHPDGTVTKIDEDGDLTTILPDGTEIFELADGSYKSTVFPGRIWRVELGDGSIVTHIWDDFTILIDEFGNTQTVTNPNSDVTTTAQGTVVIGENDYAAEIDLDGNITVTDPTGGQNVIPAPD